MDKKLFCNILPILLFPLFIDVKGVFKKSYRTVLIISISSPREASSSAFIPAKVKNSNCFRRSESVTTV